MEPPGVLEKTAQKMGADGQITGRKRWGWFIKVIPDLSEKSFPLERITPAPSLVVKTQGPKVLPREKGMSTSSSL